jgi:hypothetical protein
MYIVPANAGWNNKELLHNFTERGKVVIFANEEGYFSVWCLQVNIHCSLPLWGDRAGAGRTERESRTAQEDK